MAILSIEYVCQQEMPILKLKAHFFLYILTIVQIRRKIEMEKLHKFYFSFTPRGND